MSNAFPGTAPSTEGAPADSRVCWLGAAVCSAAGGGSGGAAGSAAASGGGPTWGGLSDAPCSCGSLVRELRGAPRLAAKRLARGCRGAGRLRLSDKPKQRGTTRGRLGHDGGWCGERAQMSRRRQRHSAARFGHRTRRRLLAGPPHLRMYQARGPRPATHRMGAVRHMQPASGWRAVGGGSGRQRRWRRCPDGGAAVRPMQAACAAQPDQASRAAIKACSRAGSRRASRLLVFLYFKGTDVPSEPNQTACWRPGAPPQQRGDMPCPCPATKAARPCACTAAHANPECLLRRARSPTVRCSAARQPRRRRRAHSLPPAAAGQPLCMQRVAVPVRRGI